MIVDFSLKDMKLELVIQRLDTWHSLIVNGDRCLSLAGKRRERGARRMAGGSRGSGGRRWSQKGRIGEKEAGEGRKEEGEEGSRAERRKERSEC